MGRAATARLEVAEDQHAFHFRQRTVEKKVRVKEKLVKKEVEVTEFCLRVGPNPIYITKIRKPKAKVPPSVIIDPNYDNLIGLIKGK